MDEIENQTLTNENPPRKKWGLVISCIVAAVLIGFSIYFGNTYLGPESQVFLPESLKEVIK